MTQIGSTSTQAREQADRSWRRWFANGSGRPRILILSQVYPPDPAAVGHYLHDVGVELVRREFEVLVLTSDRCYHDPSVRYPAREVLDGVEVRRLALAGFGKGSIKRRLASSSAFLAQAVVRAATERRLNLLLVSTSPPLAPLGALALKALRSTPIVYWLMDLNPDQAIALGKAREGSLPVRAFDWMNGKILQHAARVVVLDRFMVQRLERKHRLRGNIGIAPPWPRFAADGVPRAKAESRFAREHGLLDKRVIMYSGNHSPANPLDTVLAAAKRLEDQDDLVFVFVGEGLAKAQVEDAVRAGARNLLSFPYQDEAHVPDVLAAADVQVVTLGDEMVGIVHPCKVYAALAAGRPLLYVGPRPSHVSDVLDRFPVGWQAAHGDIDTVVQVAAEIRACSPTALARMGSQATRVVQAELARGAMLCDFCDGLEAEASGAHAP